MSVPTLLAHPSPSTPAASSLHLLPFHIAYSGPCPLIPHYFTPEPYVDPSASSEGLSRAYFRGRMLVGTDIAIPPGYTGQVWKSNGPSISALPPAGRDASASRNGTPKKSRTTLLDGAAMAVFEEQDYTSSPRRSPRKQKRTDQDGPAGEPAAKKAKTSKGKGKQKAKREKFAMSPDNSPTLGAVDDGQLEEIKLEEALDSSNALPEQTMSTEAGLKLEKEEKLDLQEAANATTTSREATPPSTPSSSQANPSIFLSPSTPKSARKTQQQPMTPDTHTAPAMPEQALVEKVFHPIASFTSFTAWNPDTALDRGGDEYVKALSEWCVISEAIHAY